MGKAKIAIRGKGKRGDERVPCRRWVLISNKTGMEIGGTNPSKHPDKATWGIEDFDRACDRASGLLQSVTVVPAWEYFRIPDPEADQE